MWTKYKMFFTMVFYSMLRRKTRLFITLLAVAVGATIISGMVTVYHEVPAQMGRAFRAYGANLLVLPSGERTEVSDARLADIRKSLSDYEIVGVAPFLYDTMAVNKQSVIVGGTDFAELSKVSPYWQIDGDYPREGEKEIMLGAEFAQRLGVKKGATVTVSAGEGKAVLNYTVSGIVRTGGKEEQLAYVSLANLQRMTERQGALSLAQVSVVADGGRLEEAVAKVAAGTADVTPQLVKQIAHSEGTVLGKLQALVLLVTIVVLVLTLICVTTTMMAVVTERRKEIGLKKALGADNRDIVLEFLGNGCLLGAFGGIVGTGLGYLFAQSVSLHVFGRGIEFSPVIAVFSLVLSVVVTGLASLVPVRIATSVDPAIVLRGE
ncbi:MAG: ABC transporter permease [Schwartzia sp.]|nr:ABC transporter permease [Schwartzia sp. (in: firmicutes)]